MRTVGKIRAIEGLRGILALWVVLGHTLAAAGLGQHWRGPFAVLAAAGNAVEAFIIVSGFVIFYLLDTAHEGYGRFMWRRALRLYPVYLICLLVAVPLLPAAVEAYAQAPWPHSLNDARVEIARSSIEFLPQHLAAHLTMVHSLLPDRLLPYSNYAILGQAWSLSLEWQFYVLAPLLFWALTRGGTAAATVLVAACAANFLIAGGDGMLPRHIPMFAVGIACYFLWRQSSRPDWQWLVPLGVTLAYLVTHSPAVVLWAAVFLAAYQPGSVGAKAISSVMGSRPLQALGRLSYSIYLSHGVVLTLVLLAVEGAGAAALGQWPFFLVLLSLTVGGTLGVSALLYRFVEAPCIALGRRQGARSAAVVRPLEGSAP
jgi:peptidoglycan/LPS O-acetylase OafA/YrhL